MHGAYTEPTPATLPIPLDAYMAATQAATAAGMPPMCVHHVSLAVEAAVPVAHFHNLGLLADVYMARADMWQHMSGDEARIRGQVFDELAAELRRDVAAS